LAGIASLIDLKWTDYLSGHHSTLRAAIRVPVNCRVVASEAAPAATIAFNHPEGDLAI